MRFHALAALVLVAGLPLAASANPAPTIVLPDQIKWTAGSGAMAGTEMAVLAGDPSKAGPFVVRIRIPDGLKLAPHTHADTERVTVLSGTMMVGVGGTMTESAMTALPAGSFVEIPAGLPHYAMAKGETVIQLGGMGPFTMTPVTPGK